MEDKLEAEDIKQSHCAFRLRIIFKAMPTVDYEINEYEKKDPTRLKEAQERQDEFVCKVVGYAEQVIAVLDKEIDEDYNQIKPCPHKDCDYWGQGGCMLPGKCIYAGDNMEGRGVYE